MFNLAGTSHGDTFVTSSKEIVFIGFVSWIFEKCICNYDPVRNRMLSKDNDEPVMSIIDLYNYSQFQQSHSLAIYYILTFTAV